MSISSQFDCRTSITTDQACKYHCRFFLSHAIKTLINGTELYHLELYCPTLETHPKRGTYPVADFIRYISCQPPTAPHICNDSFQFKCSQIQRHSPSSSFRVRLAISLISMRDSESEVVLAIMGAEPITLGTGVVSTLLTNGDLRGLSMLRPTRLLKGIL